MSDWGVGIYRLAAKAIGKTLCRHEIVESAYANRGVGRGEVTFGRSDLDLSIITRTRDSAPVKGSEYYALYRRVSALRCLNPALTHLMIYDAYGLDRWTRTDTYLGSQERRSMFFLAGKPVSVPVVPVRKEDAVRWVAFWCDRFFPLAVQQRNRRNLRKMAIEIWKAWAVARDLAAEPYLTLREAVQKAESHSVGSALRSVLADPWRSTRFIMELAGALHDSLFPPLRKLKEPHVIKMLLPPRSRHRVLVVLPRPETPLPQAAFEAQSLIATPELLHLHLHYLNPFLDWTLDPKIRELGFSAPAPIEFVRACLFFGQDNILKMPGFVRKNDAWLPHAVLAFSKYSAPYLRNGETPPPMSEKAILEAIGHVSSCTDYYLRDYDRICSPFREQTRELEKLEVPGIYPS